MNPFRRTPPDPRTHSIRGAFLRVTAELDAAQRVLLQAVPTSRDPGTLLADALAGFLDGLARAEAAMPGWRTDRTERTWSRCAKAIARARSEAGRLGEDAAASGLGFEALNARLGDVVVPLEEFADVARELKRVLR